jgi:hypothetical protein
MKSSRAALYVAAFALVDIAFLYWVWSQFPNWGVWDWDFYQVMAEVARKSVVEHGELPLWNAYVGGGFTLIGHPQNRAFNPSFLAILAFGTIPGIKICIALYLGIAQWGAFHLARAHGLSELAAILAALIFSLSGWYVQHIAHGHFTWLGFMWVPWVALAVCRSTQRLDVRTLALGGIFCAFAWLDGGPYEVGFLPVFLGLYAAVRGLEARALRPLLAAGCVMAIGAAVAAVQIIPVAETFFAFPRETAALNNFYDAPFTKTALEILYDGFVRRDQVHDPERWMPYVLNIGSYVGWVPVMLGALAVALRPKRAWPMAVLAGFSIWIYLGAAATPDLWSAIHRLPLLGSLQIPARFNVFALLALGILAGHGLDVVTERLRGHGRWVALTAISICAVDLIAVNGAVFEMSFGIRPPQLQRPGTFFHHMHSPYREGWENRARVPMFPNWSNISYASLLENTGVIRAWNNLKYPRRAVPKGHRLYVGEVVAWDRTGGLEVSNATITPNTVGFDSSGPGGLVVINQNFHSGWKAVDGDAHVEDSGGLLGVRVAAGTAHTAVAFQPRAFEWGAGVSLLALIATVVAVLVGRPNARAGESEFDAAPQFQQ